MQRRPILFAILTALACGLGTGPGCGGDDDPDDRAEAKTILPMDQVPPAVMAAAKKAEPRLTFYAAYRDKFQGQDCIELKGKDKAGKITEVEVSLDGKVLGTE